MTTIMKKTMTRTMTDLTQSAAGGTRLCHIDCMAPSAWLLVLPSHRMWVVVHSCVDCIPEYNQQSTGRVRGQPAPVQWLGLLGVRLALTD